MSTENLTSSDKPSRPRSATFLALGVFIFSGYYYTRVYVIIRNWDFWESNLLPGANIYLLMSGIIWGSIFLSLAIGTWFGYYWGQTGLQLVAPIYVIYYWIERFFAARLGGFSSSWYLLAMLQILIIAWLYWTLARPSTIQFFGRYKK